jgi:hypothetical protein
MKVDEDNVSIHEIVGLYAVEQSRTLVTNP